MTHTTYIISKNHKYESSHIYVSRILLSLPGFNEICLVSIGESRRTRIGQTPRYQSLAILRLRKLNTGSCFPAFFDSTYRFLEMSFHRFPVSFSNFVDFSGVSSSFSNGFMGCFPSKGLELTFQRPGSCRFRMTKPGLVGFFRVIFWHIKKKQKEHPGTSTKFWYSLLTISEDTFWGLLCLFINASVCRCQCLVWLYFTRLRAVVDFPIFPLHVRVMLPNFTS